MWNNEYREKISEVNYNKNPRAAYNYIIDFFGNTPIHNITVGDINAFVNSLIAKKYYKKTIANYKNILNMIFNFALINGDVSSNPVALFRLPANLPQSTRKMPTDEEIKIVNSHWEGFELFPYFLLYTGLRRSEALAIGFEDIDFKNKTITVNKHLLHNGNRPFIEYRTKTKNSVRKVILLDRLAEKLPHSKEGLLFCNEDGSPFTNSQIREKWEKYQKKYNVTLTPHQLRHAYATMLFEAGIDIKDAQELMGHSDINLTRQIYTHIRDTRKEETRQKLNEFVF